MQNYRGFKMNIQSAKYAKDIMSGENSSITIVVDSDTMSVPLESNNRHYQAVLEWAKIDGNTIADAD